MGGIAQSQEETAILLQMQAGKLQYRVEQWLPNYRCLLTDTKTNTKHLAICLADTWSYYEQHLAQAHITIELIIAYHHNAYVALPVLCLERSCKYDPGVVPAQKRQGQGQRRTSDQKHLIVSGLIMGVAKATKETDSMPERTARHYRAEAKRHITPKRGRPLQEIGA